MGGRRTLVLNISNQPVFGLARIIVAQLFILNFNFHHLPA
jgi:hypothetical protein